MIGATLKPGAVEATHRVGIHGNGLEGRRTADVSGSAGATGVVSPRAEPSDGGVSIPVERIGPMRAVPLFLLVAGYFAVAMSSYSQVAAEDATAGRVDTRTCRGATLAEAEAAGLVGFRGGALVVARALPRPMWRRRERHSPRRPWFANGRRTVVMLPDRTCLIIED